MRNKLIQMKRILIFTVFVLLCYNCSENNPIANNDYTASSVIVNKDLYATAPSDYLEVIALSIDNDSLRIMFSSGGCNGNTWDVKLIDSSSILESFPVQRNLRLSLKNKELCKAIVFKEMAFDISKLQVEGGKIQLNITNSNKRILYEY